MSYRDNKGKSLYDVVGEAAFNVFVWLLILVFVVIGVLLIALLIGALLGVTVSLWSNVLSTLSGGQ